MVLDVVVEIAAQGIEIGPTGAQDFGGRWIIDHGEQQMLNRNQLMALLTSVHEGHM